MVRLILLLVCCLVLGRSLAQSTSQLRRQVGPLPDTVGAHFWQQLAAHPQLDTTRVVWLTELGGAVQAYNVRAARPVLWAALRLARQLNYRDLTAETLLDLSDYHVLLAQYRLGDRLPAQVNPGLRKAARPGRRNSLPRPAG